MVNKNNNSEIVNNLKTILSYRLLASAVALQIVSLFASFEGIQLMFLAQPVLAGIFAVAINFTLLFCWYEVQAKHTTQTIDDGFAERRSIALFGAMILLLLSASLSSIGMYSLLGYQTGLSGDSEAEYNENLRKIKDIFGKAKDIAAKNLDNQKSDLTKQIDVKNKRLAIVRLRRNKDAAKSEVRSLQTRIDEINAKKEKLSEIKSNTDEKLPLKQRNSEMQTQVSNLLAEFENERDAVLSDEDKRVLSFDTATNRNMFDQFSSDLKNKKPLALLGVVFGIAPDLISVLLMFMGNKRKKLWLRIMDGKKWFARMWQAVTAKVKLSSAPVFVVIIQNEADIPIMRTFVPIDLSEDVSADSLHTFFPEIISDLKDHYDIDFEIKELPDNWQDLLVSNQPLNLVASEV